MHESYMFCSEGGLSVCTICPLSI